MKKFMHILAIVVMALFFVAPANATKPTANLSIEIPTATSLKTANISATPEDGRKESIDFTKAAATPSAIKTAVKKAVTLDAKRSAISGYVLTSAKIVAGATALTVATLASIYVATNPNRSLSDFIAWLKRGFKKAPIYGPIEDPNRKLPAPVVTPTPVVNAKKSPNWSISDPNGQCSPIDAPQTGTCSLTNPVVNAKKNPNWSISDPNGQCSPIDAPQTGTCSLTNPTLEKKCREMNLLNGIVPAELAFLKPEIEASLCKEIGLKSDASETEIREAFYNLIKEQQLKYTQARKEENKALEKMTEAQKNNRTGEKVLKAFWQKQAIRNKYNNEETRKKLTVDEYKLIAFELFAEKNPRHPIVLDIVKKVTPPYSESEKTSANNRLNNMIAKLNKGGELNRKECLDVKDMEQHGIKDANYGVWCGGETDAINLIY